MKKSNAEFRKREKGLSNTKRIVLKILTVFISVVVLLAAFASLSRADRAARNTVAVVRAKAGIPANTLITGDEVEKYDLILQEYNADEMILYEDVEDEVFGKYTSYYIRENSVLFLDQLIDEKPLRNEWLYSLSNNEEVLTIPYRYTEAGGDILLPGDLIRIRVSYEVETPSTPPTSEYDDYDYNPNAYTGSYGSKKTIRTDILFDSIVVKDMLNSNGRSVYEVYKEVMRLDEKQRISVMQSKEFQANIKPSALILAGKPEDMDRYATFRATTGNSSFLITILSRVGNTIGFDDLPTLETEVRSWIDGGR